MKSPLNGSEELLRLRARCFYDLGEIENKLIYLDLALKQDPDNSNNRTFYDKIKDIVEKKSAGDSAFHNGNYEDAIEHYSDYTNSILLEVEALIEARRTYYLSGFAYNLSEFLVRNL
jgi:tetratricopeptide (TPR) repeat protein